MTESLVNTLVQSTGVVGVLLVAVAWALQKLHTQNSEIQEKRIQDAQSATTQLLALVQAQHKQMELLKQAIDVNADAVQDLRELLAASVRNPGTSPRGPIVPPTRRT